MDYFKNTLFNWNGRLNRLQYFVLSTSVFGFLLLAGAGLVGIYDAYESVTALVIVAVLFILCFYSSVVLTIKRLHDVNYSGVHLCWIYPLGLLAAELEKPAPAFAAIVSFVNLAISLAILLAPGTPGDNDYGPQT